MTEWVALARTNDHTQVFYRKVNGQIETKQIPVRDSGPEQPGNSQRRETVG